MLCVVAALMILASCTNDEVINENIPVPDAVGFDVSTGKTRASVADVSVLEASSGFGVYATKKSVAEVYIDNKTYVFEGGAWKWDGQTIKWPDNDADYPMSFYAYYPKGSVTLDSEVKAEVEIAATPKDQVDLLSAVRTGVVVRPSSSKVTMDFKHMLSKIGFSVKTGAGVTVDVQSIAVRNVGNKGKFDYANQTWTVAPSVFASSYDFMKAPLSVDNIFTGVTTDKAVIGSDGYFMLMPQDLSVSGRAWDKTAANLGTQSYIEVVYRIFETGTGDNVVGYTDAVKHPSNTSSSVTGALFVKVAYPLPTNWEPGKAFTYTIHLGTSNGSGGNLIAGNFVDENGNDSGLPVVIPETEDPITVPNPIFDTDKPIGITVSVDAWDNMTAQDIK